MSTERLNEKREKREYQEYLEKAYRKNRGFVSEYIIRMWMNGISVSEHLLEKAMMKTGFRIKNRKFGAFIIESLIDSQESDPLLFDFAVKEQTLEMLSDLVKQDYEYAAKRYADRENTGIVFDRT